MDPKRWRIIRWAQLFLLASLVGCAAQERKKYDGWFPPGSTREQMITQYGQPDWTIERPSAEPSDDEWRAVINAKKEWMHPTVFVMDIQEIEEQTKAKVARYDAFSVPSHRSFLDRLDVFANCVDLVYYDSSERVIASRPLPYYAYGD